LRFVPISFSSRDIVPRIPAAHVDVVIFDQRLLPPQTNMWTRAQVRLFPTTFSPFAAVLRVPEAFFLRRCLFRRGKEVFFKYAVPPRCFPLCFRYHNNFFFAGRSPFLVYDWIRELFECHSFCLGIVMPVNLGLQRVTRGIGCALTYFASNHCISPSRSILKPSFHRPP